MDRTFTGGASPVTLVEAVRRAAEAQPDLTAMTFHDFSQVAEGAATELSYAELDRRARALAGLLQRTTEPGSTAAILCPQGLDYVVAFVGCLYAGVVAVPLYAPELLRSNERIAVVLEDCRPQAVLTTDATREAVGRLLADLDTRPKEVLAVDAVDAPPGDWEPVPAAGPETAYLQYTSGSTRNPAGVEVSHTNMVVGARQLRDAFDLTGSPVLATWLPLFHDMGLLFTVVLPLVERVPVSTMTPFAFVQRPLRWLRLLSDLRATHTVAPNFGLDLCVERTTPEQRAGLDLSALRCVVNGSEPIRPATLDRFTEAFAPHGFRHAVHSPGYGLAEATLVVTGTGPEEEPVVVTLDRQALAAGRVVEQEGGHPVVGCGVPADQEVRIADPATGSPVAADGTGEIWVRGANVCAGYWRQPERTAEVFDAELAGAGRGWLRTGDLGFLHGGRLFVAGRLKDLIIVNGHNVHPVDVELTVEEAVRGLRRGHVAAFSVDGEAGEELVVVAELGRDGQGSDLAALRKEIRRAVATRFDLRPKEIVIARQGSIPKTTSGKLQRRACRERYLAGEVSAAG